MTFDATFVGPNGYMGYKTGQAYTVFALPSGKTFKVLAPDGKLYEFSSEKKLREFWS